MPPGRTYLSFRAPPLAQRSEKIFNLLVFRPEVSMQKPRIGNRALALLGDEFVQRWIGFKVVPRII